MSSSSDMHMPRPTTPHRPRCQSSGFKAVLLLPNGNCTMFPPLSRQSAWCLEVLARRAVRLNLAFSDVASLQARNTIITLPFIAASHPKRACRAPYSFSVLMQSAVLALRVQCAKLTCTRVHGILHLILHKLLHRRERLRWWIAHNLWHAECQIWACIQTASFPDICNSLPCPKSHTAGLCVLHRLSSINSQKIHMSA